MLHPNQTKKTKWQVLATDAHALPGIQFCILSTIYLPVPISTNKSTTVLSIKSLNEPQCRKVLPKNVIANASLYDGVTQTSFNHCICCLQHGKRVTVETSMDSFNFDRVRGKEILLKEIPVKYNMKVNLIPYACFNVVHQKC